jgi:ribosomal protein L3
LLGLSLNKNLKTMETKTKFNVGDLVQEVYQRADENSKGALRVMEITAQCCYAGIQVFYSVRPLVAQRRHLGYGSDKKEYWEVGHGVSKQDNSLGWQKYREDELVFADQETVDIITKGAVSPSVE